MTELLHNGQFNCMSISPPGATALQRPPWGSKHELASLSKRSVINAASPTTCRRWTYWLPYPAQVAVYNLVQHALNPFKYLYMHIKEFYGFVATRRTLASDPQSVLMASDSRRTFFPSCESGWERTVDQPFACMKAAPRFSGLSLLTGHNAIKLFPGKSSGGCFTS